MGVQVPSLKPLSTQHCLHSSVELHGWHIAAILPVEVASASFAPNERIPATSPAKVSRMTSLRVSFIPTSLKL